MCLLFSKKANLQIKNTTDLSASYPTCQTFFKRIFFEQINNFMTSKFPHFLCCFRKSHNSRYSLLKKIKIWKNDLDKGDRIGITLMVLCKAFDTITHSLLLASLEAYGFLNFDTNKRFLSQKVGQNLSALTTISYYLNLDPLLKVLLINSVTESEFSYCPLIWIFCSRSLHNSQNHIHERAVRLMYNNHVSLLNKVPRLPECPKCPIT